MINLQVKGLNKLKKIAEQYPGTSKKYIEAAIQHSLVRIYGEEKREAPFGISGNLRDNWRLQITDFAGTLTANAPYAAGVNNGTRPHAVSVTAITPWALKHGINPWALAKSIEKKGTKANPFFNRAVDRAEPGIKIEFQTALDDTMKELSGYTD